MTATTARRIARVRPLAHVVADEQFFVANDASEFDSEAGMAWTVIPTPFPGSGANLGSVPRDGWEIGDTVEQVSFTFLAPSVPANVLGMAHNTGRAGRDLPPQAFHKAATSVVGPGDAIELRRGVGHVDPEAELTIVVGSRARGLTLDTARTAVLGFTVGNDVSARDLQKSDELWISAKSQDTFTPVGPWIVTDLNADNLAIGINHNGTELKAASSADLGWGVEEILVYLTSFMTLHPGDLVLTGFPAECARIVPGDTVICHVEGIGQLLNPVVAIA
ncbi:2-keto-4-pentenoate hydratase/2-oxohepta-3-ene-1,7-dioic acid hydratase in catechol pathway [Arthrobacter sp. V4I6]|uniref:fumarylacetoacetate hydrolase family protein n=1 Tax=unclassified Arthrobacter TaxID=235627 RepID=UPI0027868448|nr:MULTISPECIES: fumarylacetoacetate hydrolase family protein [unclassified Arthrobacter]MDQ0820587.1 2-keto-4-pentenoate hydratase/2-oxohepta-3-ene-1,7-dioic acid hydratase in catechol pathway [Arthrobacter sp. V1I7]MDQ0854845.1 2-keto-4-pentenoate hydratase/2-oxohepta-3-ene-1,7-dioic acid hydratase in catechol pathway [Arthrobacter sp. V4I6]